VRSFYQDRPRRSGRGQGIGFEAVSLNGKLVSAACADPVFARGHRNHRQDRNAALQQRDFWKKRVVKYTGPSYSSLGPQEGRRMLNTKGPRGPKRSINAVL
jgi:hypothetical protein